MICFSVNGRTSIRRIRTVPMGIPSRSNGVASTVRTPRLLAKGARRSSSGSAAKSQREGSTVNDGSAGYRATELLMLGLTTPPCRQQPVTGHFQACRHQCDQSPRQLHHTAGQHFLRLHPAPAERRSAELAMTPRISLVAVCCSNDSLSSGTDRTFSIAITAWSAKVSRSLICLSGRNGSQCVDITIAPRATPSRSNGAPSMSPCP